MTKHKKDRKYSITNTFRSIDIFGEGVNFQIEGADTIKTTLGAMLTLLVFTAVVFYGQDKLRTMLDRTDTYY